MFLGYLLWIFIEEMPRHLRETRNWKLERQKSYQYIAQFQVSSFKYQESVQSKTFQIEILPRLKNQNLFLKDYDPDHRGRPAISGRKNSHYRTATK